MAVVGSIYEALGLAGFDEIRPSLECYLGTVAGYRKNRHDELPEPLRHRIVREWGRCFDEWRYDPRGRTGSGAGNWVGLVAPDRHALGNPAGLDSTAGPGGRSGATTAYARGAGGPRRRRARGGRTRWR